MKLRPLQIFLSRLLFLAVFCFTAQAKGEGFLSAAAEAWAATAGPMFGYMSVVAAENNSYAQALLNAQTNSIISQGWANVYNHDIDASLAKFNRTISGFEHIADSNIATTLNLSQKQIDFGKYMADQDARLGDITRAYEKYFADKVYANQQNLISMQWQLGLAQLRLNQQAGGSNTAAVINSAGAPTNTLYLNSGSQASSGLAARSDASQRLLTSASAARPTVSPVIPSLPTGFRSARNLPSRSAFKPNFPSTINRALGIPHKGIHSVGEADSSLTSGHGRSVSSLYQ